MMIDASNLIYKTAGCPAFTSWAKSKKLTKKWSEAKRGDIVLFDFNRNGTSDHIGIVTKVTSSYIETIEGNTGTNNTNGDGVYRRTRYKSQVNCFVRPQYTEKVTAEMIIRTAEAEVGCKEGKNNNNKYGKWMNINYQPWCCCFVVWVFAHVITDRGEFKYSLPSLIPITARLAVSYCYKYGTKNAHLYHGGKPKVAYRKALDQAYPNRGWGKKPHAGASCDVFVGVTMRASDTDKKFPRGLSEQYPHLKKNYKRVDSKKNGDILYKNGHIAIAVSLKGNMRDANAHHDYRDGTYPVIEAGRSYSHVYRPDAKLTPIVKGDEFTEVKKLQRFLNWYGNYNLDLDSEFGILTENALKDFQKKEGLEVTGKFDKKTLERAKVKIK